MKNKNVINILGTDYKVEYIPLEECSGMCDVKNKIIQIDPSCWNPNKTIYHELIHAFQYESGLWENCDWSMNEEIVDWFALQMGKIFNARLDFPRESEVFDNDN